MKEKVVHASDVKPDFTEVIEPPAPIKPKVGSLGQVLISDKKVVGRIDPKPYKQNQEQSEETLKALKNLMSIIPLIGVCISFALLYFYPIDKNFHEKLIKDIENRRASDV